MSNEPASKKQNVGKDKVVLAVILNMFLTTLKFDVKCVIFSSQYSGGLDTSVILVWLVQKGYEGFLN